MENSMAFPQKFQQLPYDPTAPLLDLYPEELKQGLKQLFAHPCL